MYTKNTLRGRLTPAQSSRMVRIFGMLDVASLGESNE
jgi:hypothetical protein